VELLDQPGIRVVFSMPAGPALVRIWSWREAFTGQVPDWVFAGPPPITREPEMVWHDPRGPVEFRGMVPVGLEEQARELLFGDVTGVE
jgi:hypothetical protein